MLRSRKKHLKWQLPVQKMVFVLVPPTAFMQYGRFILLTTIFCIDSFSSMHAWTLPEHFCFQGIKHEAAAALEQHKWKKLVCRPWTLPEFSIICSEKYFSENMSKLFLFPPLMSFGEIFLTSGWLSMRHDVTNIGKANIFNAIYFWLPFSASALI